MYLLTRRHHAATRLAIERFLPHPGAVMVRVGQQLEGFDPIGRTTVPERWAVVDLERSLGLRDPDLSRVLLKGQGERVSKGEVIAQTGRRFVGRRQCLAPADGTITAVGPNWMVLTTQTRDIELQALVRGQVSQVIPNRGAVIEATGAYLEGACGLAVENFGVIQRASEAPDALLEAKDITVGMHNSILIGGRALTPETLQRAAEMRISGIVVGSLDAALLTLGNPEGVAVVATEGFGDVPMSPSTFETLTKLEGHEAAILRPPPQSYGHPRPAIVVLSDGQEVGPWPAATPATVGSQVQTLREPFKRQEGTIIAVPPLPPVPGFGVGHWGAEVNLADGPRFVPWLNLEQISRQPRPGA
jgi:hypothetical protein